MDDVFERMRSGFRGAWERPEAAVLLLAGLALLAAAGILFRALFSARAREARERRREFQRFAEASGLTRAEAGFLWDAARRLSMEDPALIFVRRSLFEAAAAEFRLDPAPVDSIRGKVYGP